MTTSFRDVELLSAYLDGALESSEAARLEARLRADPGLRIVMDDLNLARGALRKLPTRRAPRRFTLTRRMAGVRPPLPRAYPVLRFASALTTLLLVFTVAIRAVATLPLGAAAPAPSAFGMGGGDAAAEPEAAEAPALEEPAAPAEGLQALPTLEAADATRAESLPATPTPEQMNQTAPLPDETGAKSEPAAVSIPLLLLILALLLGGGAWLLRFVNDRTWRGKAR
jgi:hypothetical protein